MIYITKMSVYFLGLLSIHAIALEISPLTVELKTDGKTSYQQIMVKNASNMIVPVDITLNEISFNQNNTKPSFSLALVEDQNDLLVFPPALLLEPGETKAVRLQWNGQTQLPLSKSYFVRFSQPELVVPEVKQTLNQSDDENGVKIFVHFNAVVHISSVNLQPRLSVLSDTLIVDSTKNTLTVDIQNNGNRYQYLMPAQLLKLNKLNGKYSRLSDTTYNAMSDFFIPPHSTRSVTIPTNNHWHEEDTIAIEAELINGK